MQPTNIEWTKKNGSIGHVWNYYTGCNHGCPWCYARPFAERIKTMGKTDKYRKGFEPTFHPEEMGDPKRRKKPTTIFVCSMGDWMGKWVSSEIIKQALQVMAECPQHTFITLTKNEGRLPDFNPYPRNVWVGASATNQASWNRACKALRHVHAPVRLISAEPLLGYIQPAEWMPEWLIIGEQTSPRKPSPEGAIERLTAEALHRQVPIFQKNNLGLEHPLREFPKETQ